MIWLAYVPLATLLIALIAACVGVATLRVNARTRRAEFLRTLHRDFFVEQQYRHIRNLVDDRNREPELASRVTVQDGAFTDFLNFFEYVAYLQQIRILKKRDVEATFGYYLQLLRDTPAIWAYVQDDTRSFENLRKLLGRLKPRE